MRLFGWVRKTQQEREDDAYRRGYQYCAGELLRYDPMGSEPDPIERLGMESMGVIDRSGEAVMFHKGMWDALHDWNRWMGIRANL